MKGKIIYVETEKERAVGRIWRALGKNNTWRRVNAFILLLVLMAFLVAIVYLAGKYNLVHFTWTK